MGKIKYKLNTLHLSAPKPTVTEYTLPDYALPLDKKDVLRFNFQKSEISESNIFENLSIPLFDKEELNFSKADLRRCELTETIKQFSSDLTLKTRFEDKAVKSFVSRKFRKKIPFGDVVRTARVFQECREKEKKKKAAAILGDFQAVKEALPTLEELIKESKGKRDDRPRASKIFSRQNEEMMEDIQTYQQTLNSLQQVSDPVAAISAQLREKFKLGCL